MHSTAINVAFTWIARAKSFASRFGRFGGGNRPAPTRPRIPIRRTLPRRRAVTRKRIALFSGLIFVIAVGFFLWRSGIGGLVWWLLPADMGISSAEPWISAHALPAFLFALGLLVILVLWKVPKRQVMRSQGLTAENRFDRENEARKTLAQIIGGVFVLAGLYSSVQIFTLQREGQLTDRFSRAIEPLVAVNADGMPKLEVRLGAIYALERIAFDSERDQWPIIDGAHSIHSGKFIPQRRYF